MNVNSYTTCVDEEFFVVYRDKSFVGECSAQCIDMPCFVIIQISQTTMT